MISPPYLPRIFTTGDKAFLIQFSFISALIVGIFEELGWTGFAVPALRSRYGVLATGLIAGVLLGIWHLPVVYWAVGDTAGGLPPLVETHQPQLLRGFSPLSGLPSFDGLGWDISYDGQGRLRIGHSGGFVLGAGTNVAIVPGEQLGIITLTNGSPTGVAEALNQIFMDTALTGAPTQDWLALYKQVFSNPASVGVTVGFDYSKPPAAPAPALKNEAYVGTYTNDFFGDIAVIDQDGGLAIVEGPNKMTFPLTHYDRDIFTYVTTGENAVGTSGVYFILGADGKASSVRVENLDVDGSGVFARAAASK